MWMQFCKNWQVSKISVFWPQAIDSVEDFPSKAMQNALDDLEHSLHTRSINQPLNAAHNGAPASMVNKIRSIPLLDP